MTPHCLPKKNVGLGVAMPAFAEVAGDAFPSNGYMLENKTYANAATHSNMGVYDGTVTATAEYEDILYQIGAGTYLPAGATVAEQCPANSYCPGVTNVTYNEGASQGASSCPSGYPNSAAGASSNTQCYTACTVNSANIEHAMAVDGNDYYNTDADTCSATACEGGYHVNESVQIIEKTPLIDVDYTVAGNNYEYIDADDVGSDYAGVYGLTENNTWAVAFDYGVVYGRASCQATPHDPGAEYISANVDPILDGEMSPDQVRSDLTPIVGAAKANYFADFVAGIADGTGAEEAIVEAYWEARKVVFGVSKDALFSTTDTGQYCYCQMTGFQSASSTENAYNISDAVSVTAAPWVFHIDYGSAGDCANGCARYCTSALLSSGTSSRVFREAVYGALDYIVAGTCAANEITINWTDAAEADITANNAGMCTYGGDIRTPVRAATKPGKTFVGWKFSK